MHSDIPAQATPDSMMEVGTDTPEKKCLATCRKEIRKQKIKRSPKCHPATLNVIGDQCSVRCSDISYVECPSSEARGFCRKSCKGQGKMCEKHCVTKKWCEMEFPEHQGVCGKCHFQCTLK